MNKFFDHTYPGEVYELAQGEWQADNNGKVLSTLLGSCVAVCIFDLVAQAGGMTHYLLPTPAPGEQSTVNSTGRYGSLVIPQLIHDLEKLGAQKARLQAKIFGGAQMFAFQSRDKIPLVGEQNVQFAQNYLGQEKISIVASDVGQDHARKIFFQTQTGSVKLFRCKEQPKSSIWKKKY